jgi:uncharacterized protein YneF (UPF0154 family)
VVAVLYIAVALLAGFAIGRIERAVQVL